MHIAIGLGKKVIAWFGVSCIQEVDLYDLGIKIQAPVACSPCWKKTCDNDPKCFDELPVRDVIAATQSLLDNR
jgi:heptosyltransferase-2